MPVICRLHLINRLMMKTHMTYREYREKTGTVCGVRIIILAALLVFSLLFLPAADAWAFDDEEVVFLNEINTYRLSNGLPALTLSSTLSVAAQGHNNDMGMQGFFSHYSPDGRSPWDRIRVAGYWYNTYMGENIAAGYETAGRVFIGWKNSPGHNANMLNGNYYAIGIDRVYIPGSNYGWYWATEFGGVVDDDALVSQQAIEVEPETAAVAEAAPEAQPAPAEEQASTEDPPPALVVDTDEDSPPRTSKDGCGIRPDISWKLPRSYWNSYEDYSSNLLTVRWTISNSGAYPAFDVTITDIDNSENVEVKTSLPLLADERLTGSNEVTIQYVLPQRATTFHSTTSATAEDGCGNIYTYQ